MLLISLCVTYIAYELFPCAQVWFQNSRARDRREGKPPHTSSTKGYSSVKNLPSSAFPGGVPAFYNGLHMPNLAMGLPGWKFPLAADEDSSSIKIESKAVTEGKLLEEELNSSGEQPLDLSTKKSTPSNSPRPSTGPSDTFTSDSEDMNGGSGAADGPLNLVSNYTVLWSIVEQRTFFHPMDNDKEFFFCV